jgi:CHAD domain-containing protein
VGKEIADKALLAPVRKAAQDRATASHQEAAAAIQSSRYTKLILVFYSWVQGAGWRSSLTEAQSRRLMRPISGFAGKTLVHDQERLLKGGRHLQGADPETRHQVRIAAKKTRYATEFFQSLYPAERVAPYVKVLSRLQDELGWLNDAAVATSLLQDLETSRPEIANNASFVRGYLTCRTSSDDIALDRLWKRFAPTALPCRK